MTSPAPRIVTLNGSIDAKAPSAAPPCSRTLPALTNRLPPAFILAEAFAWLSLPLKVRDPVVTVRLPAALRLAGVAPAGRTVTDPALIPRSPPTSKLYPTFRAPDVTSPTGALPSSTSPSTVIVPLPSISSAPLTLPSSPDDKPRPLAPAPRVICRPAVFVDRGAAREQAGAGVDVDTTST